MGNEVNVEFINAKKTYADFLKGNKDGEIQANEKEAIEIFQNAVVEADGNGEINLGNIFSDNLDTIITSTQYKMLKNGFKENKSLHELCKNCNFRNRFNK